MILKYIVCEGRHGDAVVRPVATIIASWVGRSSRTRGFSLLDLLRRL